MRGTRITRAVVIGAVTLGMLGTAPAFAEPEGTVVAARQPTPGSYIVTLNPSAATTDAAIEHAAARLAGSYGGRHADTYTETLHGFLVRDLSDRQARRLAADPAVRTVYQDGTARVADTQQNPPSWGQDRVDQRALPLSNSYTYNNTADAVTAYVIDTGIAPSNAEWEGRASHGFDFVDNDPEAQDCHGHGSHVSGTIAGKTFGLAKKAKIVAVRALGCGGSAPDSAAVSAMEWVARNGRKPAVVNMSLTMDVAGVGDEQAKALADNNFVLAVAAGNAGADACGTSPARVPEVITVGSSERNDARSGFSNLGSCLDIFAPGGSIVSTGINGGSSTMSGTSMASPHVAGAAALYLQVNPGATTAAVRDALVNNATTGVIGNPGSGSPNRLLYTGFIGGDPQPDNDFSIGVTPSSVRVDRPGGSATATVSSTLVRGDPETITLSASGLPSGATATFDPASVTTGASSTLTITTAASTPTGTFPVTVTGSSPSASRTANLSLTVGSDQQPGELKVNLSPASASVFPGGTAFARVSVTGATGPATLTATGAPPGGRAQLLPSTVNAGQTSTLFASAGFGTPPGRYTITVSATSAGKTGRADFTLTVQSRAANPTDALGASEAGPSIVNGQPATVSEFPFIIAGLRVGSSRPEGQSCTGSVVAKRKVLTAAHCMIDVSGEKSYLYGRNDLTDTSTGFRTRVVEFKTHPNYSGVGGWQTGWDVAVVTTADDLPVQQFARIAGSSDTALTQPGRTGIPVGYGMKHQATIPTGG